jgi:hypothetical protein
MQFSLRSLLAGTAAAGAGTYALIYATPLLAAVAFTFCLGFLLAAIVLACVASGLARFVWLGVAIFGWGYLVVLHSPIFDMQSEPHNWQLGYEGPPLATRAALAWMYDKVLPLVHAPPIWDMSMRNTTNGSRFPNPVAFAQVGHTLFALIFALIGAVCGRLAYSRYRTTHP